MVVWNLLSTLCISNFIISVAMAQSASTRATSLGLTRTWNANIPTTEQSSATDYIVSNWAVSNTNFYGNEDVSFVPDPVTNNATALRVKYSAGSYAPVGSRTSTGTVGGVEFFSVPEHGKMYNTALLSYDLAFDSNFDWVKGGKLPGIFGGSPSEGCSGGEKATGSNCFSIRLMWRAKGAGEAYAYIPTPDSLCNSKQVICNNDYGTSFSRGVIQFSTKKWTRLEIYVKLNSGSNSNGILQVWQDGSLMINQQHIQFRSNDAIAISSIMFSTFFGGGSSDYATSVDTYTYFKNIQFSVGNTPEPTGDSSASILSVSMYGLIVLSTFLLPLLAF
ncbi:hypothetical protein BD560DRAFT_405388 [Blakeslea trispora]|nr:hypothetical protein BD560DRAFT_405388 [Blakeslea trispora]